MHKVNCQISHTEKLIGDNAEETPQTDKGQPGWCLAKIINAAAVTVYPIKTAKMAFPGADKIELRRIVDERDSDHLFLLLCKHLKTVKNKPPAPVIKHGANSLGLMVQKPCSFPKANLVSGESQTRGSRVVAMKAVGSYDGVHHGQKLRFREWPLN